MIRDVLERLDDLREQRIVRVKAHKEAGGAVVGLYCAYSPRELILAAGALPVSLCGSKEEPWPAAGRDLPANLCPVVKTIYDLAITDTCPFFHFSDAVVGETTCDGRKKAYERMGRLKPFFVMNLPQIPEAPGSRELWRGEIQRLAAFLEETLEVRISEEAVGHASRRIDDENRLLRRLFDVNRRRPAPLSGKDLLRIAGATGYGDGDGAGALLAAELLALLENREADPAFRGSSAGPRLLVTGCPLGFDTAKVVDLAEECGASVVVLENCGGYKTVAMEAVEGRDIWDTLAAKYLRIPCSVMTPNDGRFRLIETLGRDFSVDGVVDLTWQACHTYNIEATAVGEHVRSALGIPTLHLETDFSPSDREVLRNRLEAFLEML